MSDTFNSAPTPGGLFQSHFGNMPGTSDAAGECQKWARLVGELLAEREKLRDELAKTQAERDAGFRALMRAECEKYVCPYTKEQLFATAVFEPSLTQLVEELKHDPES